MLLAARFSFLHAFTMRTRKPTTFRHQLHTASLCVCGAGRQAVEREEQRLEKRPSRVHSVQWLPRTILPESDSFASVPPKPAQDWLDHQITLVPDLRLSVVGVRVINVRVR